MAIEISSSPVSQDQSQHFSIIKIHSENPVASTTPVMPDISNRANTNHSLRNRVALAATALAALAGGATWWSHPVESSQANPNQLNTGESTSLYVPNSIEPPNGYLPANDFDETEMTAPTGSTQTVLKVSS